LGFYHILLGYIIFLADNLPAIKPIKQIFLESGETYVSPELEISTRSISLVGDFSSADKRAKRAILANVSGYEKFRRPPYYLK